MTEDDLWPESEWLTFSTARDLRDVWEAKCLWGRLTERRCQLFAVACCRRIWKYIPAEGARRVIDGLERLADGECTRDEFESIDHESPQGLSDAEKYALSAVVTCCMDHENRLADVASIYCLATVRAAAQPGNADESEGAEVAAHCDLIRDIFGNPFRAVTIDAAWRTPAVTSLAQAAYDDRILPAGHLDPQRLSVLADALEEVGCPDQAILVICVGLDRTLAAAGPLTCSWRESRLIREP
jgi:hypothetical protein